MFCVSVYDKTDDAITLVINRSEVTGLVMENGISKGNYLFKSSAKSFVG